MRIKILITGSNSFIYSNFIKYIANKYPQYDLVGIDALLFEHSKINTFEAQNYRFYLADFSNVQIMEEIFRIERPNWVIHAGAHSNVSDSILSALPFVQSNIVGTQVMIDISRKYEVEKFLYASTDEVGGQLQNNDKPWMETDRTYARNMYSATKLSGEILVQAAHETHNLQYLITRCANNYGPHQSHKNLISQIITRLIKDIPINIHGEGKEMREWLYVVDHCTAIDAILHNSPMNEIYNIGSNFEMPNVEMVKLVASLMNKEPKIRFIINRLGHDHRYALNTSKLQKLGWKSQYLIEEGMKITIDWYQKHFDFYDKLIND